MIIYDRPDIRPYDSLFTALIKQFRLFLWIARLTGDIKELYLFPSFRLYQQSKGNSDFKYHVVRYYLIKAFGMVLSCEFNHDYLFGYQSHYDRNDWEWIKDMGNLCYETLQDTSWLYPDCPEDDLPF